MHPQSRHTNWAWLVRLRLSIYPQAVLRYLRAQSGVLTGLGIADRLQIPTPKHALTVSDIGHQIRGGITRGQGARERIERGGVRLQPNLHHLLHRRHPDNHL